VVDRAVSLRFLFIVERFVGVGKNLTSAKRIFQSARKIERMGKLYRGGYSFSQEFVPTTFGVAPQIAESLVDLEVWISNKREMIDDVGWEWSASEGRAGSDSTDILVAVLAVMFALLYWARSKRRR
jgi:hypothetical protein